MILIQVHIGNELPDYFMDSIYQTLLWHHYSIKIVLIVSDKLINKISFSSLNLEYFIPDFHFENLIMIIPASVIENSLKMDITYDRYRQTISKYNLSTFRDSFWISTTCRFFYIAKCYEIFFPGDKKVFHIENDIMLYEDLTIAFASMDLIDNQIAMVKDSDRRVVPSLMIFSTMNAAKLLTEHITKTLTGSQTFINDMDILALYPDLIKLPYRPKSAKFICDGAAIGQYLGGVDPRNDPSLDSLNNQSRGFINETCLFKMNNCHVSKIKNVRSSISQELKSYYVDSTPVINLHIHSKQLYQFSSIFDIMYDDIISGDAVCRLCDVIFMNPEINEFHKGIEYLSDKKIIIGSLDLNNEIDDMVVAIVSHINKKVPANRELKIFIYTHILPTFKKIILHPLFTRDIILYTGNSDHEFFDQELINSPKIIKIFAQNPSCPINTKIRLLPIGQANSMWKHGSRNDLYREMSKCYLLKKSKNIYININCSTYNYRYAILNSFGKFEVSKPKEYKEYLSELSEHFFCLCPRGNGPDLHRFWESLYLGSIPVIVNNKHTEMSNFVEYLKILRIPFVEIRADDLSDVSGHKFDIDEYLDIMNGKSFHTLEQLKMTYFQ
jgi:hypothetical protein